MDSHPEHETDTESATAPLSDAHRELMERFRAGQRAALARAISRPNAPWRCPNA